MNGSYQNPDGTDSIFLRRIPQEPYCYSSASLWVIISCLYIFYDFSITLSSILLPDRLFIALFFPVAIFPSLTAPHLVLQASSGSVVQFQSFGFNPCLIQLPLRPCSYGASMKTSTSPQFAFITDLIPCLHLLLKEGHTGPQLHLCGFHAAWSLSRPCLLETCLLSVSV